MIETLGNKEISLPRYMKVLHKDDKSDDDCGPIIACGIHPQDKMLVTLTSDGTFYELDAEKFFLTDDLGDDSYPIMNGSVLEFIRSASIITVDSIDVLMENQSEFQEGYSDYFERDDDESFGQIPLVNKQHQIDINEELAAHRALKVFNERSKAIQDLNSWIRRGELDERRELKLIEQLKSEIASLENHTCHACGQAFHDSRQEQLLEEKKKALQEAALQALATNTQLLENQQALKDLGELGAPPQVFYDNEADAVEHRTTLSNLQQNLDKKRQETDPYADQIEEMTKTALEEISYDTINELTKLREHEEFLLKLLTNKDSFMRKKIIDQNLSRSEEHTSELQSH